MVDDAGPVVVLCVNVLQSQGYLVKGATRGEMAVELLGKESFDILLVDYRMPGMNGFQVFQAAREANADMACVLVTAHGTKDVMEEATRLGFDAILLKPFTPQELRAAVDKAVLARKA